MWNFIVWLFSIKIKKFSSYTEYRSFNFIRYWKCEINGNEVGFWDEQEGVGYDFRPSAKNHLGLFRCTSIEQFRANFN